MAMLTPCHGGADCAKKPLWHGQKNTSRASPPDRHSELLLDDISTFGHDKLECAGRNVFIHLHPAEQDIGALTDTVDQLHIVDLAVAERQPERVEQGVFGFGFLHELQHLSRRLGGDVKTLINF